MHEPVSVIFCSMSGSKKSSHFEAKHAEQPTVPSIPDSAHENKPPDRSGKRLSVRNLLHLCAVRAAEATDDVFIVTETRTIQIDEIIAANLNQAPHSGWTRL